MSIKAGNVTFHYKKICLSFEVAIGTNGPDELISDERLKAAFQDGFSEYTDGRRLFSVEMIQDGLTRLLKNSIHKAVYEDVCARHQDKVTLDGTSLSCKLTDAKTAKLHGLFLSGDVEVLDLKPSDKG